MKWSSAILLVLLAFSAGARSEPARIVYHLHQITSSTLMRAISNIENLYRGMQSEHPEIHMLLQGESLLLLTPEKLTPWCRRHLRNLLHRGLILETGAGNYRRWRQRLDPEFRPRLTRNILARLVELQRQGYQYVTP